MKFYAIYHVFDDDMEYVEEEELLIGFVDSEDVAKAYCNTYENQHVYGTASVFSPSSGTFDDVDLKMGHLYYKEIETMSEKALSRPPYKNWYDTDASLNDLYYNEWDDEEE